jgi:antitoxin VapB
MSKTQETDVKTERLIRVMVEQHLDGVLINAQHNFAWLTAGGSNGVDQSREPGVASLLVRRDGKRFVLASKIEMARMLGEEITSTDFEPIEFGWEEEKGTPGYVANCSFSVLGAGATLGSDLPAGGNVRLIEDYIARARFSLTEWEIDRLRSLGSDSGRVIGELVRSLEPGLTEVEIGRRAADALAGCGARIVVGLVAADERLARFRHPVSGSKRWERIVMVVVCARREGLTASLTRIVCVGSKPDDLHKRTVAAARVNGRLLASTNIGVSGSQLYEEAARGYEEEGYPAEIHLHHQGGAIGYRTRDWVAHPRCSETVQEHQAFAWNPSITGTKVEETCIVMDGHLEIVTASPGWPSIAVQAADHDYALPDVLEL